MSCPRVWILDPDSSFRDLLVQQLSTRGYEARGFSTVSEVGVAIDSGERPSVMVVEPVLPYGDGQEIILGMKADPRTESIPILLVTLDNTRDRRIAAIRMHVEEMVLKPVTVAEVCRKIAKICGRPLAEPFEAAEAAPSARG